MLGRAGVTLAEDQLKLQFPMVNELLSANSLDGLKLAIERIRYYSRSGIS